MTDRIDTLPALSETYLTSGHILKAEKSLEHTIQLLKKGVWLYILLLIFEGALRKWFLPFLATPLLVVREPIALWLIFTTWNRGLFPSSIYLAGMTVIGVVGVFTAVLFGHGNLYVALFGARIFLLNFPMIFVIGRVFSMDDINKLGRFMLWTSISMLVLITLQFYSPQSAWVNRGVGGDTAGAGFAGALGFYRPPGTFSFTNGTTLFFNLVAAFVFYFWLTPGLVNRLLLLAASLVLIVAIPITMSRGYFYSLLTVLVFTILACFRNPKYLVNMLIGAGVVVLFLFIISLTPLFDKVTKPFLARFQNASASEGGVKGTLGKRYLGGMTKAISDAENQPFLGYGIGMGTNAGSSLIKGHVTFLISEEEWAREIGELGPFMGLLVVVLRISLVFKIARYAYTRLGKDDFFPWILLSIGIPILAEGTWAQPTALGFSVLLGGLFLASLKIYPDRKPS